MQEFGPGGEGVVRSEGKEFLDFLAEIADPADLPLLIAACAGRKVYVPDFEAQPDCWIFLAIGREKGLPLW
ncbi:hypothetical protein, partial [Enterococcus faecium]|uniref:hypothetical protein n=1 Tax=Enterococcus faecium TaxID=1352 RepID=UPI001E2DE09C